MIAYPSPDRFTITTKAPLLSRLAWTPPVLVGTRVYLRDRRTTMAVDLGLGGGSGVKGGAPRGWKPFDGVQIQQLRVLDR